MNSEFLSGICPINYDLRSFMFKINPSKYLGVTVIPSEIIEKHLILSSAPQLKVILYAYSNAGGVFDEETVAAATGINENEVKDALSYWRDKGFILHCDDEVVFEAKQEVITVKSEPEKAETIGTNITEAGKGLKKIPSNNPPKLTYKQICQRIDECADIPVLLNEAQLKLGRTIGTGDQSSLILLYDYYGLPIEVILSICEFASTRGKSSNMNYIYKIGVDWSQREIDTLEAADEELKRLEKINSVWNSFCAEVKLKGTYPTSAQEKYINQWTEEWRFSLVMLTVAYEEMMLYKGKFNFPYMHKILSDWHKKGINTPEKVSEEKESFIKKQEKKAFEKQSLNKQAKKAPVLVPDPTASYDIRLAEELARTTVPKVKKREKR